MSAGKGTYWANKALDLFLGGSSYVPPSQLYFSLFLVVPSAIGLGTEVTGSGYARAAVPNNSTFWPAAVAGAKANLQAIVFPAAIADWGVIVGAAVFDQAVGGNLAYFGTLQIAQSIFAGDTAQFAALAAEFRET